jgi:hypothetical protein
LGNRKGPSVLGDGTDAKGATTEIAFVLHLRWHDGNPIEIVREQRDDRSGRGSHRRVEMKANREGPAAELDAKLAQDVFLFRRGPRRPREA